MDPRFRGDDNTAGYDLSESALREGEATRRSGGAAYGPSSLDRFPPGPQSPGVAMTSVLRFGRLPPRGKERLRRFAHNLRRGPDFFYFFARNPLKSPHSEK